MAKKLTRTTCRLCSSRNIEIVLRLNKSPLCDVYLKEKIHQENYNLHLCACKDCRFVQIDTVINQEIVYNDYIYETKSSSGLNRHFEQYANDLSRNLQLGENSFVVDIGSNDGTFLNCLSEKNLRVLGVDPAKKIARVASNNGMLTLPQFFDRQTVEYILKEFGTADVVTVNNLFANIDDVDSFVQNVDYLLERNGVLVIESSYLLDLLDNTIFDFIYHEHLSYLSIIPLRRFFKKYGMQLMDVSRVGTKGGSLRYYWSRCESKWKIQNSVNEYVRNEEEANINGDKIRSFGQKIAWIKTETQKILEKSKEQKVVGYGASATSTTLISHFELYKYLDYLVDDNPSKIGSFSPGYHIPVYSSEKILESSPDLIVILAWRYADEIIRRQPAYKGAWLVPLPSPEVFQSDRD